MHEIRVPEMGESITEGTLSVWIKKNGDVVKQGEVLAEIETDKVNIELSAEADGVLQIQKQVGEDVHIGEIIGILKPADSPLTADEHVPPSESDSAVPRAPIKTESIQEAEDKQITGRTDNRYTPYTPNESDVHHRHATPAERKRAREREIHRSGDLSRTREQSFLHSNEKSVSDTERVSDMNRIDSPMDVQMDLHTDSRIERVKMSRRRKTIASRLLEAQHSAAMLTTFNEVDLSAVMEVRNRHKEEFFKTYQVKLGFMSFFTKAVVSALKYYPYLNAEIQGDEILLKKFYDIGIAVSADEGLVVPVVRHADQLNFAEIEREIDRLAERARNNALSLSDLQGGTFTITNGGVFGSLLSTPILNPPQVGILGMHTIQHRPVAIDKKRIEIRPMMYIALSYDHRIVDGKEAVQFLVKVKQLLEDPEQLMLEG